MVIGESPFSSGGKMLGVLSTKNSLFSIQIMFIFDKENKLCFSSGVGFKSQRLKIKL